MREAIGSVMQSLVVQRFTSRTLQAQALAFIDEKLKVPVRFGMLTLFHNELYGGMESEGIQAAAAVELFVLASDIIDDLQDQDSADYAWMKVPHAEAMQTAVSLLTLSQEALYQSTPHEDRSLRLVKMMNAQLLAAANGQMNDIRNEADSEDSYLAIVRQKSAAIMVFACMAGVLLAGQPWSEAVAAYAEDLGIAAQLRNDLRGFTSWDAKNDFLQRKRTLLTLFLMESELNEDTWIADYFEGRIRYEAIAGRQHQFEQICERTGTLLYGAVMSRMHYNRFIELVDRHGMNEENKQKLLSLVD